MISEIIDSTKEHNIDFCISELKARGWILKCDPTCVDLSFYKLNKGSYEIRWWGKPDYIEIYDICEACTPDSRDWVLFQGRCPTMYAFDYISTLIFHD